MVNDQVIVEMELSAGVWTSVTADVLQAAGISGKQGMMDSSPLTRVAGTGTLNFVLRNDAGCSGGKANYYTPGNANCRAGFESGIAIRLRIQYSQCPAQTIIYGHIPADGIKPLTGIVTGYVKIEIRDYMEQLALHEMYLPTFTTNKTMEEIIPLIIAEVPMQPLSIDLEDGETTFATVFDTVKPKTRALAEINKIAISELGYAYTKPGFSTGMNDVVYDEVLASQGQLTRSNSALAQILIALGDQITELLQENGNTLLQENGETILLDKAGIVGDAIFDDSMSNIDISHAENYYNIVKVTIPPRKVDVLDTTVLYSNPTPFFITAGLTKTVKANFRDPDSMASKVTCESIVSGGLVAGTDYKFTENANGTGANRTANAGFSYVAGAEGIEFTWAPTLDGWVYIQQARGRGVYAYEDAISILDDPVLTTRDGERMLTLDMKYRDRPLQADDIASVLLTRFSQKDTLAKKVDFVANRSEFLMMAFLGLQVGDKILVNNTRANVNAEYFINGKTWDIGVGAIIHYSYILAPAAYDSFVFWELGVAGKGELELTTFLGF